MQFLFLLIVNIIMGAIFYLIISLKLEKSASVFREKKLRREMDEIMTEFNAAAERNITLLENKIQIAKRLLEQNGQLKSMDFEIKDEDSTLKHTKENGTIAANLDYDTIAKVTKPSIVKTSPLDSIKNNMLMLFDEAKNRLQSKRNNQVDYKTELNKEYLTDKETNGFEAILEKHKIEKQPEADALKSAISKGKQVDFTIEKDYNEFIESVPESSNEIDQKSLDLNEKELEDILLSSTDRRDIITQLHDKGLTIENISKYSGIPEGEVKLVLNLSL